FFSSDPSRSAVYTLSLHDALPILPQLWAQSVAAAVPLADDLGTNLRSALQSVPLPEPPRKLRRARVFFSILFMVLFFICAGWARSEEHTSELQSRFDIVCRLLLEK